MSHVFLLKVFMSRKHCVLYWLKWGCGSYLLHLFTSTYETKRWPLNCQTNHSVCLKPAAVKEKQMTNCKGGGAKMTWIMSHLRIAMPHQYDKQSPHTPWWCGLWAPRSRSLLTKGFLGSLCEESQWHAWVTSASSQSQQSCNDLYIASPSDGGEWPKLQPACINRDEWKPLACCLLFTAAKQNWFCCTNSWCTHLILTPHRTQMLCSLVDRISLHMKSLDSDAQTVPEERWRRVIDWGVTI